MKWSDNIMKNIDIKIYLFCGSIILQLEDQKTIQWTKGMMLNVDIASIMMDNKRHGT